MTGWGGGGGGTVYPGGIQYIQGKKMHYSTRSITAFTVVADPTGSKILVTRIRIYNRDSKTYKPPQLLLILSQKLVSVNLLKYTYSIDRTSTNKGVGPRRDLTPVITLPNPDIKNVKYFTFYVYILVAFLAVVFLRYDVNKATV